MTPNQPNLARRALLLLSALLLPGSFPLQAANPHDEASPARNLTNPSNPESALRTVPPEEEPLSGTPQRREHLAPRDRAQHTVFANAGYLAILSALYFEESSSGSLNSGFDLMAGYNWTSRRGLGVGIIYSGGFISAERDAVKRTTRLHYIAPEFVARQRAGRRWLFREAVGVGYGRYVRSYGERRGSRGGAGIHERASVEFMLTRHIGLSAEVGGQWLIVRSPDVGDGAELTLNGILRFQCSGGIRLYF
ncbi:hypothetical protein [uncultured Alistipes sp.]|mgnify:FL=1|jgi:hypothetical protein|uniref:hypothetical protein n=1 Tax=uncultured Alistipes sp. TaxID=538949 RepID=UPI0025E6D813|nr:hypothetical protein [uncultured Alistipes sp.]